MEALDASRLASEGLEARVLARCGSTNTELLASREPFVQAVLLATEEQTAGRGRRGRRWHAAPHAAITFSLARRIARAVRELPALSLVAGVALATALRALGAREVALKWPNDLVARDAKLGGILVETRLSGGMPLAVVGVGLNYSRDEALGRRLGRAVVSLEELIADLPGRNAVIRTCAAELLRALERFERDGLDAARSAWPALDANAGRRLRVRLADGRTVTGLAAGLAEDGALRLETRAGTRVIRSGRVAQVRARAA
ncbi:MAG: biotin--[acetyl-CoA-carboxylase] ligase [Betaproteobacteria bacterium]|nr:biotin--[acetyl-CoA-carboxylase] ligase [Betaproteobacteria bacterium]